MGDPGLVVFGRDHGDVAGEFARDRLKKFQPLRVDAVIVGDQDSHDSPFARGLSRGERVLARFDDSRDGENASGGRMRCALKRLGQRLASIRASPPI